MKLELDTRSNELGDVLKVVDQSIRFLNTFSEARDLDCVEAVSEQVEWSLDKVLTREWVKDHPELHEVVCFLDLACFSLLRLNGESFRVYLEEINYRYRNFLTVQYIQ
ncbi:hypothetical protein IC620_04845 [Hazenella sp. IB182357]|uniref:Uncharacterized protein n=1 Tax=Polycladospora coralii TaxID=2771432 RepID=A0A926RSQ0_9BACL|nr:hypothetical protein [Polycladospora coralii]MBD1371685.1 hypothetical protein [Polycladospora coralii]MBS7529152.1 hypothetical protein [Polycladospora coralii]